MALAFVSFVLFVVLAEPIIRKPAVKKKMEIKMLISDVETAFYWCVCVVIAVFFLILIFFGMVSFCYNFTQELKYLNNEIERTSGSERRYWIRRRWRLWLSLIPFVKY